VRARALFAVVGLGWGLLVPSPALAGAARLELAVSDPLVTYGEAVAVSGAIVGDAACAAGRPVALQWRAADSAGFATVAEGTTAGDGAFAFEQAQPHTGTYRAIALEAGTCGALASPDVEVRVRALVEAALVLGPTEVGSCLEVSVSVSPAKPGQAVLLEHRRDGWRTRETLTLDAQGRAHARPCLGFDDLGVLRLRLRWEGQDGLNETAASAVLAFEVVEAAWMREIDRLVRGRGVSVAIGEDGLFLYRHADRTPRIPASNEKLLLAMAMLDAFGPRARIPTSAAAVAVDEGVVDGDLWILGRGDPSVGPAAMRALARRIADAGITRITGSVLGSTTYFLRDWDAQGWNGEARRYVNRPTALTFDGNRSAAPEREAARALTARLETLGVRVRGEPGSGRAPAGLVGVATVRSAPLLRLLSRTLRPSDNFVAEVLGKRLGAHVLGAPGSIAKGAAAIEDWVSGRGAAFELHDASGLSYDNRVTAEGLVRLLWQAEAAPWGTALRRSLPTGGQGTLRDRLPSVRIRAKTGTLTGVSALSGWVGAGTWVEFSILSSGMPKANAAAIEDRIVRIVRGAFG